MTKNNNEDFKNSTKWWICNNDQTDGNVKVRDNYHIIGKKRLRTKDCNINVKLSHKIPVVFHNLKKL